jgi:hypothetical protein
VPWDRPSGRRTPSLDADDLRQADKIREPFVRFEAALAQFASGAHACHCELTVPQPWEWT